MATFWFSFFFFFFFKTKTQKPKTNKSEFNTYLKYSGYLTVGIDMVRGGKKTKRKKTRGSSLTTTQNPKEYPNLPKTEQCASEIMDKKKKIASSQSRRPQRSMLHLWGCSGDSSRLCKPNLIADINIYVFLNLFNLFIVVVQYSLMAWFGRWVLYRILKRYQN